MIDDEQNETRYNKTLKVHIEMQVFGWEMEVSVVWMMMMLRKKKKRLTVLLRCTVRTFVYGLLEDG